MNPSIRIFQSPGGTCIEIGGAPIQFTPAAVQTTFGVSRFNVSDGTVYDSRSGLTWSLEDVTDKAVKHDAAEKACRDLRLGGFDDWRLPTRAELLTLVDDTRTDPAIDKAAFPSCKSECYWTSTAYAASPSDYAWIVSFDGGHSYYDFRGARYRVRAVRGPAGQ